MPKLSVVTVGQPLPEAPYPSNTRSKGWIFELDIERVQASDTWRLCPTEIRPWLLMMWMESWLCTPCGSHANDDDLIAARLGMPLNLFRAHHTVLLRGWRLHADGRLYHSAVTERVLAMIEKRDWERAKKASQRWRYKNQSLTEKRPHGLPEDTLGSPQGVPTPPPPPPPPPLLQKQRSKPKARSRAAPAPVSLDLPPWLKPEDWQAFVEHRSTIKKPMTDEAQRRAIIRLGKFRRDGHDPAEVLNLSIIGGWQGLFTSSDTKAGQDLSSLIAELNARDATKES